ncbi:uracil-DNA glycosylase [candidate division WWE3 bacterium]|nr:uracil-DNA glycosylase [candidate division WWE3 bacterium]
MEKQKALAELFFEMEGANLPLTDQSPLIPGDGNPNNYVVFIGEAGGFFEAKEKRPFVGQAGKLLNSTLAKYGLDRNAFWVTNIVKARPPENRDPLPEEIGIYRPYLERELAIIEPKVIVTLGRFAMNWFLPEEKISRCHGNKVETSLGITIFPLYHPAAALRASEVLAAFNKDVETLSLLLKSSLGDGFSLFVKESNNSVQTDNKSDQPSLF